MAKRRRVLACEADEHAGHKLGLMNPETVLIEEAEDGTLTPYTPELTMVQEWLWKLRQNNLERLAEIAGRDEVVYIHAGDITHGLKYPQHLVSNRMSDQILMAVANVRPVLGTKRVRTVRLIKGTGVHVFGEGSSEILVADRLRAEFPALNVAAVYHGDADVDGMKVDYTHHGPGPGSREWLRGNVARFYLRDLMMRRLMAGKVPPRLVVRAHYHALVTEELTIRVGGCAFTSELVVLPSMCGMGEHARKATRSFDEITCGMVVYEVVEGTLRQRHELTETLDIKTQEVL